MTPDISHTETPQQALERLRAEIEELRTSRERLARATDADRRRLERELHDGLQQQLVALAVNLELARRLADSDPVAVRHLLAEMGRDVRRALDETAGLAHRIYPPLLEAGGLGAAVRTAAAAAGVPVRLEVAAGTGWPMEVAGAVYFACLDALESAAGKGAPVTVTVFEEEGWLVFEIVGGGAALDLVPSRDRVEAFGGRIEVESVPGGGTRISGSLPLS